MKNKSQNIGDHQEEKLFSQLEVNYSKGKDEVWESMELKLDKAPKAKLVSLSRSMIRVAAAVLILIGIGCFMRFYTLTIHVAAGDMISHTLPDGSRVHLNAASQISYQPYWWAMNRKLELDGEAFFEVAKGEKFSVRSDLGTTSVLGTSFNIYARNKTYEVYCKTGKVRVTDQQANEVVLTPSQFASLDVNHHIKKTTTSTESAVLSWRLNKFIYNNTPLSKVFADVGRHYNIQIDWSKRKGKELYTGLFQRDVSPEEALKIICLGAGLQFSKNGKKSFIVK